MKKSKKPKAGYAIGYCILMIAAVTLFAALFVGCTIYETVDVELIRCPAIRDTVYIPDWEVTP